MGRGDTGGVLLLDSTGLLYLYGTCKYPTELVHFHQALGTTFYGTGPSRSTLACASLQPASFPSLCPLNHAYISKTCWHCNCALRQMRDGGLFPAKFTSAYAREWPLAWTAIDDDKRPKQPQPASQLAPPPRRRRR